MNPAWSRDATLAEYIVPGVNMVTTRESSLVCDKEETRIYITV